MKIFQVIIFVSAVTFFCCASHASSDVDVEQVVVRENPILEYNLIDEAIKIVEGGVPPKLEISPADIWIPPSRFKSADPVRIFSEISSRMS